MKDILLTFNHVSQCKWCGVILGFALISGFMIGVCITKGNKERVSFNLSKEVLYPFYVCMKSTCTITWLDFLCFFKS